MNRLQRKCLIVSLAVHLLLVAVLIVGPAFLLPPKPPVANDLPILHFIPTKLLDELGHGGGRPGPLPPPAPMPKPREPAPAVVARPAPRPPPATTKSVKPDKINAEPIDLRPKPVPDSFSLAQLKPVKRPRSAESSTDDRRSNSRAREAAREAAAAQERQRLYSGVLGDLKRGLSSSAKIEAYGEEGTGGPAYANYFQAVVSLYDQQWYDPPTDVTDTSLDVVVEIVLARSGRVLSSRIIEPSHKRSLDASVRRVLDRVDTVPPFPEGAKEQERTYRIKFNLKSKLPLK